MNWIGGIQTHLQHNRIEVGRKNPPDNALLVMRCTDHRNLAIDILLTEQEIGKLIEIFQVALQKTDVKDSKRGQE